MLHAELGRYPLEINIKMRMLNFWLALQKNKPSKISFLMYKMLRADYESNIYEHKWIRSIKGILESVGRNDFWLQENQTQLSEVKSIVFQTLLDQYKQKWRSTLDTSSKSYNYKLFKTEIELEHYLTHLPRPVYLPIIKFRTSNHRLPIEKGRWENVPRAERTCTKCSSNSIGDEFHYIMECKFFKLERQRLIRSYYYNRPNVLKFNQLLQSKNSSILRNLSTFTKLIMNEFNNN